MSIVLNPPVARLLRAIKKDIPNPSRHPTRSGGRHPKEVKDFHFNDDTDSSTWAHHHTLGFGALQAAPGNHFHDLPGQPIPWISDVNWQGQSGVDEFFGENIYVLLNGLTDLKRKLAPKLFRLWGTSYGVGDGSTTFGTPDLRDRYLVGAGFVRAIGVTDTLAFGAARTARMQREHDHDSGTYSTNAVGHNGVANTVNTGAQARITSIGGSLDGNHAHNVNSGRSGSLLNDAAPSIGVQWLCRIQ